MALTLTTIAEARACNLQGRQLIERFEGLRLVAYQDQKGIWSIGYGHTLHVYGHMMCSQAQADAWLQSDLGMCEDSINELLGPCVVSSNQFSAMCSMAYNIGCHAFSTSSVLTATLRGDFAAAANAFMLWNKITENGTLVVSAGLNNRRQAERALYLKPDLANAA